MAWLAYGKPAARLGIHLGLAALMLLSLPSGRLFSDSYGLRVRRIERRLERSLIEHAPAGVVLKQACPTLHPDARFIHDCFRMLKAGRVGAFAEFEDERISTTPDATGAIRR
jgi:hypothetical protein